MTPWVTRLLVANVAVFFLHDYIVPGMKWQLAFVPAAFLVRPWTIVTYMFVHAGWWHLIFNMIGLFFFGPRLEARISGRHFVGLYFAGGILGALLSIVTPYAAIVGASGAVFGVLLGYARFWPRDQILIWGVFPIEARWLVAIMTVLSLFGGFTGSGRVAHFAHLGGFLGGYLYLKWLEQRSPARRFRKKVKAATVGEKKRPDRRDVKRWSRIDREDLHPVNRAELDRVLGKIEEEGPGSLTDDERAFLDRFTPD